MEKICIYLASKCPEALHDDQADPQDELTEPFATPIQLLQSFTNGPAVQKVLIAFLRLQPHAINAPAINCRQAPKSIPFLREVHGLVVQEKILQEEIDSLANSADAWHQAVANTTKLTLLSSSKDEEEEEDDDLLLQISACNSFEMWSKLRQGKFQGGLERIAQQLTDICRKHEAEDEAVEEEEEEEEQAEEQEYEEMDDMEDYDDEDYDDDDDEEEEEDIW